MAYGFKKNEFLQTNTLVEAEADSPVAIREYKVSEITRTLPHIASGTYGIVYKGKVKVCDVNLSLSYFSQDRKSIVAIKDIKVTGTFNAPFVPSYL